MTVAQYEQHYAGWLSLAENGRIRKPKFVDMMVASGVDKEMAEILFDTYDADGSGYVFTRSVTTKTNDEAYVSLFLNLVFLVQFPSPFQPPASFPIKHANMKYL